MKEVVESPRSHFLCVETLTSIAYHKRGVVKPVNQSQSESIEEAEIIKVSLNSTSYTMGIRRIR
jgi:hypothetical protein